MKALYSVSYVNFGQNEAKGANANFKFNIKYRRNSEITWNQNFKAEES